MKKCNNCNLIKTKKEFSKDNKSVDKLQSYCKSCNKIQMLSYSRTLEGKILNIFRGQKRRTKLKSLPQIGYTKQQFLSYCLVNKDFIYLYNDWVNSNYIKDLAPTFDRLNDYEGYKFGNIQPMVWHENRAKSWKDRKEGVNNKTNISINKICSNTGEILNTYHSIKEASRIENLDQSNITKCCKNKYKHLGGFNWEYAKD